MTFIDECEAQVKSKRAPAHRAWPAEVGKDIERVIKDIREKKAHRFPRAVVVRALQDKHDPTITVASFIVYLRDNHGTESWDKVLDASQK